MSDSERPDAWARYEGELRDPADIVAFWCGRDPVDARAFECEVRGQWWDLLQQLDITLLVTREYEHLFLALSVGPDGPHLSHLRMAHPSGVAVDHSRARVYVASTRNPNQIYTFSPSAGLLERADVPRPIAMDDHPLLPVSSWFFPGCLYLHDLVLIDADLYGTAVGHNAVVRLTEGGRYERVWWPRCIDTASGPLFGENYLQLNSIAAGAAIAESFFSASTDQASPARPGDPDFPVDGRGVVFSGASREVVARGLTRPHSLRLRRGELWVDNSGYGEVGRITDGIFEPVYRLPGWTRGLQFYEDVMFVGTSRVLSRFRQYAPGLDLDTSQCGVHAIDLRSGELIGSICWPFGNQIFAIEWVPRSMTKGLPFRSSAPAAPTPATTLFYAYQLVGSEEG